MQFGAAITEYILPGLPVTAVLAYGLDCAAGGHLAKGLAAGAGPPAVLAALGVVFLGIAYMLGILVHFVARWTLLNAHRTAEERTWAQYGALCSPAALEALGEEPIEALLQDTETVARPDQRPTPRRFPGWSGWTLWRMRLFLCHHSPRCAEEILKLQAISRAARGAFALPLSLAIWLVVDLAQIGREGHAVRTPLLTLTGGLCALLWWIVGRAYHYRWGVVCRGSIAAFLVAWADYKASGAKGQAVRG